jgi:hypothetical protein
VSEGDHEGNDWISVPATGYGELAALYNGVALVQEDPCFSKLDCVWAFINGSTSDYGCGTPPHPEQATVPYENAHGQYVDQQIRSPWMDITTSSGTVFEMNYLTYWDLQIPNLVFSDYHVRGIDSTEAFPCPSNWFHDGFVNFGDDKTWAFRNPARPLGLLVPLGSTHIQISLDVVDYCQYGFPCAGSCHSHAPVYDDVTVYRVSAAGPQFYIRDIDQFQDNFPDDGTITGTARADMAADNNWSEAAQAIVPGDSAVVQVSDPEVGLDTEGNGRASVFFYLSIDGPNSDTVPTNLVCDARFPYIDDVAAGGRTWHRYQADTTYSTTGQASIDGDYCFDLCDDLFVPGDTVWFFWGARNNDQVYAYGSVQLWMVLAGQTGDIDVVAANADEFQILPAVGRDVSDGGLGGDILYVDGSFWMQPYFDTSFENLGILDEIDRYDIRGPGSGISDHPGHRVKNVINQLVPIYKKIFWDCGVGVFAFADGTGDNIDKSDDTGLAVTFLDNIQYGGGGFYLCGDIVAAQWLQMTASDALSLRNVYMGFDVTATDHQPTIGYNPWGIGVAGGMFSSGGVEDSIAVWGGCPSPNTFDILDAIGDDTVVEMNYHNPVDSTFAPAILSQRTENQVGDTVGFVLSGFGFHVIMDLKPSGFPVRYTIMQHILEYLDNIVDQPVGSTTPKLTQNKLEQNIPNPFNPTTTIKYEVKESGLVHLRIYNVAGQLVKTLVDEHRAAGQVHEARWNGLNNGGRPVSSGVYFYKLVATNFTQTKKMVLMK